MLRYVLFDLNLFGSGERRDSSQKALLWLLESLSRWNQIYLQDHPDTPKRYKSGVKYAVPAQFDDRGVPELVMLAIREDECGRPVSCAMANALHVDTSQSNPRRIRAKYGEDELLSSDEGGD